MQKRAQGNGAYFLFGGQGRAPLASCVCPPTHRRSENKIAARGASTVTSSHRGPATIKRTREPTAGSYQPVRRRPVDESTSKRDQRTTSKLPPNRRPHR
uniref:Uncharacterized protein n=1 Tax=Plectus sambesii TaxID=2011161 RepID=A0A914WV78_9BILA